MNRINERCSHRCRTNAATRSINGVNNGGFTLIEILVVISIIAIISAITIGGFGSVGAGNKRTSCQANLTQIYAACQQYAADEGGKFPFYDPAPSTNDAGTANKNIGLWALYTFPQGNNVNLLAPVGDKPIERYLRSSKSLHCPNDNRDNNSLYTDETRSSFNQNYLSYQVTDPDNPTMSTYDSIRTTDKSDPDWSRQLLPFSLVGGTLTQSFRTPSDKTVVTWCPFHRTGLGGRPVDPVLFYDGSVQLVPVAQPDPDTDNGATLSDWHRKPRRNE